MLVLTVLAFTAVLGLGLLTLSEIVASNLNKIVAALRGHSLMSEPVLVTRPVTIRVATRRVSQPVSARPQLRAAA